MVSVIILVFLFNLTYNINAQHRIPIENNNPSNVENDSKLKNNNPSSSIQATANTVIDQKNISVSHVKISNDPFTDHNVNHRQLEKDNAVIDQNPKKSNSELDPPKAQPVSALPNKPLPSNTDNLSKDVKLNDTINQNKTVDKNSTINPIRNLKDASTQTGPLIRGFYVFLGLSVIMMMYFIFRSYRLRNGSQPSTTVKKYGVTARRSDMEMRPLELDDEDDDTLFEISNQNANR